MRRHPRLLEISAWPWLERLSRQERRQVSLADVPHRYWDGIAGRFDVVFLMGVWRRSPLGRLIALDHSGLAAEFDRALPGWTTSDVVGSPYCIQQYVPDARMGGWNGLDEVRRQMSARGIRLVLDFVPNHTAFDHPWIAAHPERYVLGADEDARSAPTHFRAIDTDAGRRVIACGRDPHFAPWTDVAQLNYFNPDTRDAMLTTLHEIAAHCDGVRCDMAMLLLNDVFDRTWRSILRASWPRPDAEFWPAARAAVPKMLFLAEAYWGLEGRLLDDGFDFVYGKELLDALVARDGARAKHLLANPRAERFAWFLENHDEPRSAASLADCVPAAAALVATVPGMRFFNDGQLEGWRVRAPVQLGRWPAEPADANVQALYDRVLAFAGNPVFEDGQWSIPAITDAGDETHRHIVAILWKLRDRACLVVANVAAGTAQAHVAIAADLPPGEAFDFEDRLTGITYPWPRQPLEQRGLYVRLEPGAAHLFQVRRQVLR